MKKLLLTGIILFLALSGAVAQQQEFYELRIYHYRTDAQQKVIDDFLRNAYLPALHRTGIPKIGVFSDIEKDTADRKIYLLTPVKKLAELGSTAESISKDKKFLDTGKEYLDAAYNNLPYSRLETILLKAFSHNPVLQLPQLKGPLGSRVYELRSYEGHTEKIFKNKVQMFNEGGEVALFKRLGFNAVFYAEVVAGSRMPNLMYMTTFEDMASREEHWKKFVDDPEWKKLSSMPEYQNNVSKINIYLLKPAEYSDY